MAYSFFNPDQSQPTPPPSAPQDEKTSAPIMNYQALVEMYHISDRYKEFLSKLTGYHVVIIADDSGSMTEAPPNSPTRWADLLEMIDLVIQGSAIFDPDGIDIHFLNRGSLTGISSPHQLDPFRYNPSNYDSTPLVAKMSSVLESRRRSDKKTLLVIATDGHPTEGEEKFTQLMKSRERDKFLSEKCAISFLMCTNEEDVVKFYDKMKDDYHYHHVEVTETYAQEYDEVVNELRKESFTRGDHVIKMLLGPIVPEIGEIDQPKPACCVIL